MKPTSIFNRYLFREMIPPFVICVLFFTLIFLMTRMLDITNMVVNYHVSPISIFWLIIYMMPFFLIYIFPMATMLSTLVTLLKMSSDNEIVAMKASGVSIYRLMPPVLLICLIGCLLTAWMSIWGLPWGRLSFKKRLYEVASRHIAVDLKERTFHQRFSGLMIYASRIDNQKEELTDMLIKVGEREEDSFTIVSPRGKLLSDPSRMEITLQAFNGMITKAALQSKEAHSSQFKSCEIRVDLSHTLKAKDDDEKDEEEMSLSELRSYLNSADRSKKQYHITLTEFHRKFAVPFACFSLGLISFPIGIQFKSRKKSFGLGLSVIIFLVYYLLLSIGWVLGEAGVYPPIIGMWVPNVVIGGLGIYFIIRTANENPIDFTSFLYPILDITKRLRKIPPKKRTQL